MNLSKQRAGSVVKYLADKHGIDKARLQAEGVGYLAPVATNETPDGRSQNRRVELVKAAKINGVRPN
jgi:OOP family OmpA-OmpF porin